MINNKSQPNNKLGAKQGTLLQLFSHLDAKSANRKILESLANQVKNFLTQQQTEKKNHRYRNSEYENSKQKTAKCKKKDQEEKS